MMQKINVISVHRGMAGHMILLQALSHPSLLQLRGYPDLDVPLPISFFLVQCLSESLLTFSSDFFVSLLFYACTLSTASCLKLLLDFCIWRVIKQPFK